MNAGKRGLKEMKSTGKLTAMLMALTMIVVMMLAGCSGERDYSDLQQGVVKGGSVFVTDNDVVFFGYDNLLCSALFDSGNVYDFVVEGGFTGDVYALAVYDNALYVSASDGIFRYDLDLFSGSGTASPEVLWDKNLSRFNTFQIYDGKLFFNYGTSLSYIPIEGGEAVSLTTETGDFEVTSDGIYYSKRDGGLHLLSPDLSEDKEVGQVAAAAYLTPGSDGFYYKEGGSLKRISPDSGKVTDIETGTSLGEKAYPWAAGGTIMYSDDDDNYYRIDGDGETLVGQMTDFPQKYMGYAHKDWIVSQAADYSKLDVISLKDDSHMSYDLEKELGSNLSQSSGGAEPQGGTSPGGKAGTGNYDMTDGMETVTSSDGSIEYIYFNDFMMTMPNNEKWSMTTSPETVTFYLVSAQQEGYGGKLVSITAYDPDDNTYTQLPSYHEAGITANTNVRLVAEYPTDAQWNTDDAQQTADYKDLYDYLQKIGAGAVNSPLQTGDGD